MTFAAYDAPLELVDPQLRPGCALLDILTCGVWFSDVKTWAGQMPFSERLTLPHVPGHEICAEVIETDPPGALATGTRVVVYHLWPCRTCDRCRAGEDNLCQDPIYWTGFTSPGGFRENGRSARSADGRA
jgi:D-arabinose 1-dehydrogenase-like Zn-dependent alcohol dehydrogenase